MSYTHGRKYFRSMRNSRFSVSTTGSSVLCHCMIVCHAYRIYGPRASASIPARRPCGCMYSSCFIPRVVRPMSSLTTRSPRPKFLLILLRTPRQPPNLATFLVPLKFNKLDLKDYLWHAYGVPVLRVRSRLCYEPPTYGRPEQKAPQMKRWRRRQPSKRMTVEIAPGPQGGDFVWPEEIKDLSPYVVVLASRTAVSSLRV